MGGQLDLLIIIAFFFQGPVATIAIITSWVLRAHARDEVEEISGDSDLTSSEISSSTGQTTYFVGLILTSIAVLLDWIAFLGFYSEQYPRRLDGPIADVANDIMKAVPVVSGFAFLATAFGKGKGKALTLTTSFLLVIASLTMIILQACSKVSY